MIYLPCAVCRHLHAIDWSPWCAVCWGDLCGDVPGSPADETVEVCDDGVER